MSNRPMVLIPFDRREACSPQEAAAIAGRSGETIRRWCAVADIGRPVAGRWMVSRVALAMYLDNDQSALADYLSGDRGGARVKPYFDRVLGCR